jgi:hypothetical protein
MLWAENGTVFLLNCANIIRGWISPVFTYRQSEKWTIVCRQRPRFGAICMQIAQAPFNTLSFFVTLKIAKRIAKMRKTVGFLLLGNTPRFLLTRSVSFQMSGLDNLPDDVLNRIFDLADRQNNGNTGVIFCFCCVCRMFRRLLSDTWHWAYFGLEFLALSF